MFSSVPVILAMLTGCTETLVVAEDSSVIPAEQQVGQIARMNADLGVGYLREGRLDLAYKRLDKALRIAPDFAGALTAMGLVHDQLGRAEDAEKFHRRAVEAAPRDSVALNNFGTFLCRRGRMEEAMPAFRLALSNPLYNSPEVANTNAGLCLARNGQPEEAEVFLRRALERNPRIPAALVSMSELSLARGRELAARGYLQRYLEVAKKHTSRSLWLGVRIERGLGDQNAVSSYAIALKSQYPDAIETKLLLESETE